MTKIIAALLKIILKWIGIHEQKKKQRSRDELEKNPGKWFADNFNGRVRDIRDQEDASEADPKPSDDK